MKIFLKVYLPPSKKCADICGNILYKWPYKIHTPQAGNPNKRTCILNVIQVTEGRGGWSSSQKEGERNGRQEAVLRLVIRWHSYKGCIINCLSLLAVLVYSTFHLSILLIQPWFSSKVTYQQHGGGCKVKLRVMSSRQDLCSFVLRQPSQSHRHDRQLQWCWWHEGAVCLLPYHSQYIIQGARLRGKTEAASQLTFAASIEQKEKESVGRKVVETAK